jgi:hypothetical protein
VDDQRPTSALVVLRQLEVFAAPPADEDSSYKWMGPPAMSISSSGDKMSAASRLLDFVDALSLLPGVAIVGLLRQGYTLPSAFLRPPRFDHTFTIPAPPAPSRLRLLRSLLGQYNPTDTDLRHLAEVHGCLCLTSAPSAPLFSTDSAPWWQVTQGYVLRDLVRLSRRIALHAQVRAKRRCDAVRGNQRADEGDRTTAACSVERQDMDVAMAAVRPSQMFELTVRPPRVNWDNVAGCDNARRELEEAIKYALPLQLEPVRLRMRVADVNAVVQMGPGYGQEPAPGLTRSASRRVAIRTFRLWQDTLRSRVRLRAPPPLHFDQGVSSSLPASVPVSVSVLHSTIA